MNCESVRQHEAAYALDALDDATREAVRSHLSLCDQHPDVPGYLATSAALGLLADEQDPPPALRERILRSAGAARPSAPPARTRQPRRLRTWTALAAALAVAIAVGAVMTLLLQGGAGDGDEPTTTITSNGITVRLAPSSEEPGNAVRFQFEGLEPSGDEAYVVWAIRGSEWLPVGRFEPDEHGNWDGTFVFQFQEGDALCLTMTGTETPSQPFGDPIFMEPI